jgi:hypothetical protein
MTQLTYRGVPYFKEEEDLRNRNWWNLAHRPNLWLRYRGCSLSSDPDWRATVVLEARSRIHEVLNERSTLHSAILLHRFFVASTRRETVIQPIDEDRLEIPVATGV